MHMKKKLLCIAAAGFAIIAVLILGVFFIVRAVGMKQIQSRTESALPGRVKYDNRLYEYNEDNITFLIMGIDKGKEEVEPYETDDGGGGQADALFLAVLDTKNKTIKVIGINRNTMTDISIYDAQGRYYTSYTAQIALQHAYGDGRAASCEYQVETVRNLFYQLPIHGYAAVNINAIPAINDIVGGVDVVVAEDLTKHDVSLAVGNQVHLMGESAYWYVKYRDIDVFASVDMRMARQKQYLDGFINAAKQSVRKNIFVVINLYHEIKPQMTTDISLTEAVYLASLLPQYQFDENSFYMIEGNTVMGEEYEEFYVDEDALLRLILDIFYREVK